MKTRLISIIRCLLLFALALASCERAPEEIMVSSVSFNTMSIEIKVGETARLEVIIEPDNATDKEISWISSNPSVASVYDGQIEALSVGNAKITAEVGGKMASCAVVVVPSQIAVTSIALNKTAASLKAGETVALVATVNPSDATDKTVTWSTSDASVATVKDGVVTAVKIGSAEVTAKAGDQTATCAITVVATPVTSITLDRTTATLKAGETVKLTATVGPEDATDRTVIWETSDESVATVSNGVVTAQKVGTATVTAKAGEKTASCLITVETTPVFLITLDRSAALMTVGQTITLTATISPADATDKTVTWSSSDASVATVSNGVVTAQKVGTATVTAKAGEKTASCLITVLATPVTSVTLDKSTASLMVGETVTLTATVNPENATDKTVTWTTSNASVATVEGGVVSALKVGRATITAKAGEKTATCTITVVATPVSAITLDVTSASMMAGEAILLTATVYPETAADKTVTWTTSDASVVTVSRAASDDSEPGVSFGYVIARTVGTATITAKAGDKTATCTITVIPTPVSSITLDITSASLTAGQTLTLTATVDPADATDKTITWTTSDATVATVSNGVVTAIKAGTALITAKAGEKTASCTITVKAAHSGSHEGTTEEDW